MLRVAMLWPGAALPPAGASRPDPGSVLSASLLPPVPWKDAVLGPGGSAWGPPDAEPRRGALADGFVGQPARASALLPASASDVGGRSDLPLILAIAATVGYGEPVMLDDGPDDHRPVAAPVLPAPAAPMALAPPASAPTAARSRWSAGAWIIGRADGLGGARDVIGGSQLGGSQAGARLAYALDGAGRFGLAARVAAPLEGRGRELGLGAEWRVLPGVRLVAERRVSLDGGRGGPALSAVGGAGPVSLGAFRLEAYGQAGAVRRARTEPFADGAARLALPLGEPGPRAVRMDLGAGAWGAAQRGASRLDVGPSVGAVVPLGGRSLRLTLDWRQRVGGDARPRSGPALSAGIDF